MSKIGFVITVHWSDKIRPNGKNYALNLISSIKKYVKHDYTIYIIDNESQHEFDFSEFENLKYTRIEDQSVKGLTGAWNLGISLAHKDKCDVIIVSNDDLEFNDTINKFIDYINEDKQSKNTVYGPVSNGVQFQQKSNKAYDKVFVINSNTGSYPINGFLFAFTSKHFDTFKYNDEEYFNINNKHNGGDGKWGGQEGQFIENIEKGSIFKILAFCWIKHYKETSWKIARNLYKK